MKTSPNICWGQKLPIQKHNAATHFKHNLWVCMAFAAERLFQCLRIHYHKITDMVLKCYNCQGGWESIILSCRSGWLANLSAINFLHAINTHFYIWLSNQHCINGHCVLVFVMYNCIWTWEGCKSSHLIKIRQCIQDLSNETFLYFCIRGMIE